MKFSKYAQRFLSNSGTLQLMDDLGAANASDEEVLMLGGGNPSHIPEVELLFQKTLLDIATDRDALGAMLGDYDGPQGNAAFIELFAEQLSSQYGLPISAYNIALTNGSQSSFGLIFNLLAGEFDDGMFRKILLPVTPEYIGYADASAHESNQSLIDARKPLVEHVDDVFFKYHIDFENLNIDQRYGAVCVSRPTNPSGNVISDTELRELSSRCRAVGIPLIIDGAYGLPFPGMVFTDASFYWDESVILCLSLSKLGLPGARTGIIVASEEMIALVRAANASNALAPGSVGPTLAAKLIAGNQLFSLGDQWIKPYYQRKMLRAVELVKNAMHDLPVKIHQPEGALFLWLWFEGLPISSDMLYQRLKQESVYVLAGQHFFPGLAADWQHKHECIRINFAGEQAVVEQGIAILEKTVRKIYNDKNGRA